MRYRDPNLVMRLGSIAPDPWEDNYRVSLPLTHVISRRDDGTVLSILGDVVWDMTPYHPRRETSTHNFQFWNPVEQLLSAEAAQRREALVRESQFLMALLIYYYKGRASGHSHLGARLRGLKAIASFAEAKQCSIRNVLESRQLLDSYIGTALLNDNIAIQTVGWLNVLWSLDPRDELGYEVARPNRWGDLLGRIRSLKAKGRQHAPLPTRVYGSLINNLARELDDIDDHKAQLLAALKEAQATYSKVRDTSPDFEAHWARSLIAKHGLQEYLQRRDLGCSFGGLSGAVTDIYRVCKIQLHVFSGMRHSEAAHLPFHCMELEKGQHGRRHCLILGITTKLEKGFRRRTKWVTTEMDGFRAIRLAQDFSSIIYTAIDREPSDNEKNRDEYPLFLTTAVLPWVSNPSDSKVRLTPSRVGLGETGNLRSRICPIIEETDLVELEEIDPFRDWRSDPEFALGSSWQLKTHQLRRSLALYANASGLVRISSLRRQLQHISREMTLYYARGSAYAKNFLTQDPKGYKTHIVSEWQDGSQEADYLAFVRDVLRSDEELHGAAGKYYELQKKRGEVLTEQELKKQIRMGRLSYRPSPLGGCTNSSTCENSKSLRLIDTTCATDGCKHLIGKHSKIIQTIQLQRSALACMDPHSITYQIEAEELSALEAVEKLWRPKGAHGTHKGQKNE